MLDEPEQLDEPAGIASDRLTAVSKALKGWIDRLIDLSRRNNLLYFRHLKLGTVELQGVDDALLRALLAGESVRLTRLLPRRNIEAELEKDDKLIELFDDEVPPEHAGVLRRLKEIQKKAIENFEERGLETMFLAVGLAKWTAPDDGRDPAAPIVLVPIRVEGTGTRVSLVRRGDLDINLALVHVLETQFKCGGLGRALRDLIADEEAVENGEAFYKVASALETAAAHVPGFDVENKLIVSNFSFQKLAMVRDLQRWGDKAALNDMIAGLAGHMETRAILREQMVSLDPRELDKKAAISEFLVRDADSSQQNAIASALAGHSGVVVGPPGTGKSQTITNLIGEFIANGKTVLFVAEKRAALDVVKRRLEGVGLGHLLLDLHGHVSKKDVMGQFRIALDLIETSMPVQAIEVHTEFESRRRQLLLHLDAMHMTRDPFGLSVYVLQGRLLRLPEAASTDVRWTGKALLEMTPERVTQISELLLEAQSVETLFLGADPSPWTGSRLESPESAQEALETAQRIVRVGLPTLGTALAVVCDAAELRQPATLSEAQDLLGLLNRVTELHQRYQGGAIFGLDLRALITDLEPASKGARSAAWAWLTQSRYRATLGQLKKLRIGKSVPTLQLLAEANEAQSLVGAWAERAETGAPLRILAELPQMSEALAGLESDVALLESRLAPASGKSVRLALLGLSELMEVAKSMAKDRANAVRIPKVLHVSRQLATLGAGDLVRHIVSGRVPSHLWDPMLKHAWYSSCYEDMQLHDSHIATFDGRTHDEIAAEFRKLDHERMRVAVSRIKHGHAGMAVDAMNADKVGEENVRHEAGKSTRHRPIRELVRQAPGVMTGLKPCWMASPLAISQILAGSEHAFDVVIFDEASQVLPEDSITAVLRGRALVVAGDPKQLPPSPFFVTGAEEADASDLEELDRVSGFDSVLDVLNTFLPRWDLLWHYRSRDERLIAFSNRHFYDGHLVTFPNAHGDESRINHVLVPFTAAGDGQEESSSAEVIRVVELILKHAETRPNESLGVIAMGIKHARRLEAKLELAKRQRPDLDGFFDGHADEPFFQKNLERVQGDERDAIILSIGYGKDRTGRLLYQFGPILKKGGERRLNVAITRAKERLTVVSSFGHEEIDPSRSGGVGLKMLRDYLAYASSRGQLLGDFGSQPIERNDFEIAVEEALVKRGLKVTPQFGSSKYRIDLVAHHPTKPGRMVLAIECDGATYHSAATARDRDRLRQEHLQDLGWRFCRVWSTDWFLDPEAEADRVVEAYHAAVNASDDDAASTRRLPPSNPTQTAPPPSGTPRGPRPGFPTGLRGREYARVNLDPLVMWIQSDNKPRTDTQIVDELIEELGFRRHATDLVEVAHRAVHHALHPNMRYEPPPYDPPAAPKELRPLASPRVSTARPVRTPRRKEPPTCLDHRDVSMVLRYGTAGIRGLASVHYWACARRGCNKVRKVTEHYRADAQAGSYMVELDNAANAEREVVSRREIGRWDPPKPARRTPYGLKFSAGSKTG